MFRKRRGLWIPERYGGRPGWAARSFPEGILSRVGQAARQRPAAFGRAADRQHFPPCRVTDNQRGNMMTKKIEIANVPELTTSVGMHGSVKQKEVGGPICLAIVIAALMAVG